MTFKNRITPEDWTRFGQLLQQLQNNSPTNAGAWKFTLMYGLVIIASLLILAAIQVLIPGIQNLVNLNVLLILYPVCMATLILLWKILYWQAGHPPQLKEDGVILGDRTISTEPAGIRITTNGSETLLYWSALESFHVAEEMILIYVEPMVAYCVVRHACTPAEFDAFLAELRAHAPQLRESSLPNAEGM